MESKSEPQYYVNSTNFDGHYLDSRNFVRNQDTKYDSHPAEPYDKTGRDGGRDYSVIIEHGNLESRRNDSSRLSHSGSNYDDVAYAFGSIEEGNMLRTKFEHSQHRNDAEVNGARYIEGDGRAYIRRPDMPLFNEERRRLEMIHVDGSYHPSATNRAQRERKVRSTSMLPSLSPACQSNSDHFNRTSMHHHASQHPLSFYLNHSGDPAAAFNTPDLASKGNLTVAMGRSFSGFSTPNTSSSHPQFLQQPTAYNTLPVLSNTYDFNLEDIQINEQKEKLLLQRQRRQQLFLEMQKETEQIARENLAMARTLKGRIEIFTPETAPQSPMTGSSAPDSNRSAAEISGQLLQTDFYNDNDDSDFLGRRKEQTVPSTVSDFNLVEKQEITLATLDIAHKQEMKEIEHEIDRLKLMRADAKKEEERAIEVTRADARRLEKLKERRDEEEKERREDEEKKRREEEKERREDEEEKKRREEQSKRKKEEKKRREDEELKRREEKERREYELREKERREFEVKEKERREEIDRADRLKATEDRLQAERIEELKQKIEKQRRQYEAKKKDEEAAKILAKDSYRSQLLRSDSNRTRIETIHPIPSTSSAPLRGEDSISMKEDRPKRKPSRKDSIEKMSMKDKLKLKIEKSERNLSVCASNVNDISRGADSDKGGGSYRGTSFSKRKHCQDSRVERSGSQRKSFEHAEPVSLILPASPRRSPSFAFQAWTKCTPRPSPATVQYKQNANQSLEFYVDRATGLPENCTVSRVSVKFMRSFAMCDEVSSELDYCSSHSLADCWNTDPEFRFKIVCALGDDEPAARNTGKGEVKREDLHSTVNGPCITDETVTAHIRIDTINSVTLMPCVVGCAVIKVFRAPNGLQPLTTGTPGCTVNDGLFQLPLFAGSLPLQREGMKPNDSVLKRMGLSRLPCASITVQMKIVESALSLNTGPDAVRPFSIAAERSARHGSMNDISDVTDSVKTSYLPDCDYSQCDNTACEPLTPTDIACQTAKVYEAHMQRLRKLRRRQGPGLLQGKGQWNGAGATASMGYSAESFNAQSITIESAITLAINSVKNSAIQFPLKPDSSWEGDVFNSPVQSWLEGLLPLCAHLDKRELLDYSFASPYNKERGLDVCINQLHNMPGQKKGVFAAFSTPSCTTMHKVIYSVFPGGSYYKENVERIPSTASASTSVSSSTPTTGRSPWGIRFTETVEVQSASRAPIFSDGPRAFYPRSMNLIYNENESSTSDVFLILDVRTVSGNVPKTVKSDSSELSKAYWAILPLSKDSRQPEEGKRKSNRFVNTGTFQLPLFEGSFPYKFLSEAVSDGNSSSGGAGPSESVTGGTGAGAGSAFEAILSRLATQATPNCVDGPWPLNSSGASVIVTVGNPLLSEFPGCTYDIEHVQTRKRTSENTIDYLNNLTRTIKENVREGYLEDIIHAHNLNKYCVNTARTKDFSYDEKKHPPGKSTVEASLKSENISELLNSINEEFSVSTGIPKQS